MQDYRYMATSDLQGALEQESFKTDEQTERTLARLILQQLEDPSGDISSLAVKWCVRCRAAHLLGGLRRLQ